MLNGYGWNSVTSLKRAGQHKIMLPDCWPPRLAKRESSVSVVANVGRGCKQKLSWFLRREEFTNQYAADLCLTVDLGPHKTSTGATVIITEVYKASIEGAATEDKAIEAVLTSAQIAGWLE